MKILRRAGKFLKNRFQIFRTIEIVCLVLIILLVLISFRKFPTYIDLGDSAFTAGLLCALFMAVGLYSHKHYQTFKKGFDGEQKVSDYLESKLSDDFYLINDAKQLYSNENIDHIVLAPNGIFVLETKNNDGTIIFKKGDEWDFGRSPVSQARHSVWTVYEILSRVLKVKPDYPIGIVVFPNAKISRPSPTENQILTLEELPNYILNYGNNQRRYLSEELEEIGNEILRISEERDKLEKNFTQSLVEILREYYF